ncbi:hypothetical protein [Paenibacillus xylanexedens]
MNTIPSVVDVLIVGAGPTGLTLACSLLYRRWQKCGQADYYRCSQRRT